MVIEQQPPTDPHATRLRAALAAEYVAMYGSQDLDQDDLSSYIACYVAIDDTGTAVGTCSVWEVAAGACEIGRLYVVPPHRGTGLSRALIGRCRDHATRAGYVTATATTAHKVGVQSIPGHYVETPATPSERALPGDMRRYLANLSAPHDRTT